MHHHSRFFFTIFFILLYGPLHAQHENIYQAHPIHLPDFFANRTIKSVFQDHIGLLWIGTKNGVYTYDGIKVQPYLQNGVSPISAEVINIVEDVYRNLWICTTKGPLILNQNRSKQLTPKQLGIPASISNNINFSVCQMTNGQLLLLSGDDLYVFRGNQIKKWLSLPTGTIPVAGARLYFINKEQSVMIHSSLQHVILHVSSNGKVTRLRDDFALTLTQINHDSLLAIVIDADFQNSFLNYSTVTHHFTESKHKILLERMLTTPVHDAMNRQNIKMKHLGDWRFFPLWSNSWAVSCNEGLFLVYTVDQLFKPITPTKGHRIRGIASDRYNNIIYQ
jgi:hypothetical protein